MEAHKTPAQVAKAKEAFASDARSALLLRAAGMKIVGGTDTGQTRHLRGYFNQLDLARQRLANAATRQILLIFLDDDERDVVSLRHALSEFLNRF